VPHGGSPAVLLRLIERLVIDCAARVQTAECSTSPRYSVGFKTVMSQIGANL
jgi:hypothetical protein